MEAIPGHPYAHIADGVVRWVFTSFDLPEWNEADFVAVDINGRSPQPAIGWTASNETGPWVFTAPVAPDIPLPQQADAALATKIANGITLTSTGTPALNGVYALDSISTAQIFQIGLYANQFSVFPSGGTTQPYPDASGTPHMFSVTAFIALLRVVAPLVSALTTQAGIMAQGGTPSWPAQTATIA